MGLTTSIILGSLPAVNGGLLGCLVLRLYRKGAAYLVPGGPAIAAGIGIQIGLVLFSSVMHVLDRYHVSVFHYASIITFAGFTGLVPSLISVNILWPMDRRCIGGRLNGFGALCVLILVLLVASSMYLVSLVPAQAWDGLDFWLWRASEFINHESGESYEESFRFSWREHHPPTVSNAYAWTGWAANSNANSLAALAVSIWIYASVGLLLYGFSLFLGNNKAFATLVALVVCSAPLLHNHIILAGYADLWIANLILSSLVVGYIAVRNKSCLLFGLSITIGLLNISVKDVGIIYAATTTLLVSFTFMAAYLDRWSLGLLLIVFAMIISPAFLGFEVNFLGTRVAFNPNELSVEIGRRHAELVLMPFSEVVRNVIHALIFNFSYSIFFIAFICASANAAIYCCEKGLNASGDVLLLFLLPWSLLLFLILIQLLSEIHFSYSSPDFDTYFSRFALMWLLASMPLTCKWVSSVVDSVIPPESNRGFE